MPNRAENMLAERGAMPGMPTMFRSGDPFVDLREHIDRLFGNVFGSVEPFGRTITGRMEVMPRVDVAETDEAITITADLPGVDEKDVDLTLVNGVLTLRGEKKAEKEEKEKNYHVVERSYGSFTRSFRLPDTVNPDKVAARFDKGVLIITVPKAEDAKTQVRRIAIGGNGQG